MKIIITFLHGTILSLIFVISGCDNSTGVVTVNIDRVIEKSPLSQQEQKRLEEVRNILLKINTEAEKNYKNIEQSKLAKVKRADAQTINGLWVLQRQAIRKSVLDEVRNVVYEIRLKEGYKIVIDKSTVINAEESTDITDEVIDMLENAKVDFGPLPQLTIKSLAKQGKPPVSSETNTVKNNK